jgi:hypothetical protein
LGISRAKVEALKYYKYMNDYSKALEKEHQQLAADKPDERDQIIFALMMYIKK